MSQTQRPRAYASPPNRIFKIIDGNYSLQGPGLQRSISGFALRVLKDGSLVTFCKTPTPLSPPLCLQSNNSCVGFIAFGIYLLNLGMTQINIYNISELYGLGFGTVSANSVVSVAPTGLLATTLFANLPQAILSFLYLTYNGLFSCMLGSYEWSRFGRFRKSLRVTAPAGNQRSTYYLQLPYTYAIASSPPTYMHSHSKVN